MWLELSNARRGFRDQGALNLFGRGCAQKWGGAGTLSTICMQIHLVVLVLKAELRMRREGQSSCPLTHVS